MKGTPHSTNLLHYWNLTIRLFSVISRILVVVGVLCIGREAVGVFYSPSRLGDFAELKIFDCAPVAKTFFKKWVCWVETKLHVIARLQFWRSMES